MHDIILKKQTGKMITIVIAALVGLNVRFVAALTVAVSLVVDAISPQRANSERIFFFLAAGTFYIKIILSYLMI